jgi:hypothetical protein
MARHFVWVNVKSELFIIFSGRNINI